MVTGSVYGLGGNHFNQVTSLPATGEMINQPTLVTAFENISISTVHAGCQTSFAITEAGELFSCGFGAHGKLATGTAGHRRTGLGRVETLHNFKVCVICGSAGLLAVATNAHTGNEEYYTWGDTCANTIDVTSDRLFEGRILFEPHRVKIPRM